MWREKNNSCWRGFYKECQDIFNKIKTLPEPHMNRQNGFEKFIVFVKTFAKMCVCVVIDYADMVSVYTQ